MKTASETWTLACAAYEDGAAENVDLPMREMVIAGDQAAVQVIEQDRAALTAAIVRFLLQPRTIDNGTAWAAMEIKAGRFGNG